MRCLALAWQARVVSLGATWSKSSNGKATGCAACINARILTRRDRGLTARWLRVEWLWQEPLPKTLDVVRELRLL